MEMNWFEIYFSGSTDRISVGSGEERDSQVFGFHNWKENQEFYSEYTEFEIPVSYSNKEIKMWIDGESINKGKEPNNEAWGAAGEDYDEGEKTYKRDRETASEVGYCDIPETKEKVMSLEEEGGSKLGWKWKIPNTGRSENTKFSKLMTLMILMKCRDRSQIRVSREENGREKNLTE